LAFTKQKKKKQGRRIGIKKSDLRRLSSCSRNLHHADAQRKKKNRLLSLNGLEKKKTKSTVRKEGEGGVLPNGGKRPKRKVIQSGGGGHNVVTIKKKLNLKRKWKKHRDTGMYLVIEKKGRGLFSCGGTCGKQKG